VDTSNQEHREKDRGQNEIRKL